MTAPRPVTAVDRAPGPWWRRRPGLGRPWLVASSVVGVLVGAAVVVAVAGRAPRPALVAVTPGLGARAARAPVVVVVAFVAGDQNDAARQDRDVARRALEHLEGLGVQVGPVRAVAVRDDVLARVLVAPRQAGDPCGAPASRAARRRAARGAALVVVFGGTIRTPALTARLAGRACAGAPPLVLLDRRGVNDVDLKVVLLHEIGHAAGLGHVPPGTAGPNAMEAALEDRGPQSAGAPSADRLRLDAVEMTPAQVRAVAALLAPAWPAAIGRVSRAPPLVRMPEGVAMDGPHDDAAVLQRINALVEEEHRLREHASAGHPLSEGDEERLRDLEVGLDQCWDLLRQRRARRDAGTDPDDARPRDPSVVEGYLQ